MFRRKTFLHVNEEGNGSFSVLAAPDVEEILRRAKRTEMLEEFNLEDQNNNTRRMEKRHGK